MAENEIVDKEKVHVRKENYGVQEAEGAASDSLPPVLREHCSERAAAEEIEIIFPSEPKKSAPDNGCRA